MKVTPFRKEQRLQITDITATDPIVVTTAVAHNLVADDEVLIYGVDGITIVNQVNQPIVILSATTFELPGLSANNVWGGGGIVQVPAEDRFFANFDSLDGDAVELDEIGPLSSGIFVVEAADTPAVGDKAVKVQLQGRVTQNSAWVVVNEVTHTDTWVATEGGTHLYREDLIKLYPRMRINIVSAGVALPAGNKVKAWLLT